MADEDLEKHEKQIEQKRGLAQNGSLVSVGLQRGTIGSFSGLLLLVSDSSNNLPGTQCHL